MDKLYTIVVPTYNEKDNILPFLLDVKQHCHVEGLRRIIFVDDNSPDGTAEHIKKHVVEGADILCIHRVNRNGLSTAVVEGIMLADTEYVAVMDVDGQHKASDLAHMLQEAKNGEDDLVMGSRFLLQDKLSNHVGFRHQISQLGNKIARTLLKRSISDPLTGFFVIKRQLFIELAPHINSNGFKILFDILYQLRNSQAKIKEVQIDFGSRNFGESKLDAAVMLDFSDQVIQIATRNRVPPKFTLFCLIGASGVAVNYLVLSLTLFSLGLSFVTSQTLATLAAMISNYHFNNLLTFCRNKKVGMAYFTSLILAAASVPSLISASRVTWSI